MPGLYARDAGGVARKYRELHEAQGGVDRKLREMYARNGGGVQRRVFSGLPSMTFTRFAAWDDFSGTFGPKSGRFSFSYNIADYALNQGSRAYIYFKFSDYFTITAYEFNLYVRLENAKYAYFDNGEVIRSYIKLADPLNEVGLFMKKTDLEDYAGVVYTQSSLTGDEYVYIPPFEGYCMIQNGVASGDGTNVHIDAHAWATITTKEYGTFDVPIV